MGHGAMRQIARSGEGSVITGLTMLGECPVNGARQVVTRRTRIGYSEEDDPARVAVLRSILERKRRLKLANGDPWPEDEMTLAA